MITRLIAERLAAPRHSLLLLGPRQTGKSTLINSLRPDLSINLVHEPTYLEFASNPRELESRLGTLANPASKQVFIDEVQRLPSLLNTIQALIDAGAAPRFLLTGSSARKLRRGGANLLPGRVLTYSLGPIACAEMDYQLPTQLALSTGTLPGIISESDNAIRQKLLRSYAATYLKEEIQAESLTRNLEGFSRFLKIAAEWSGHFLDLSKMAQAAQIARQSVVRWFEILEDTLIVNRVDAYASSLSKRLVRHPKFYFFDTGVLNGLIGNFTASADRIGLIFEHLIVSQLKASAAARDQEISISTFRTEAGVEVDFIVELNGETTAIELKASQTIGPHDLRGLKAFSNYAKPDHSLLLYLGEQEKVLDDFKILPWQEGIKALGL